MFLCLDLSIVHRVNLAAMNGCKPWISFFWMQSKVNACKVVIFIQHTGIHTHGG